MTVFDCDDGGLPTLAMGRHRVATAGETEGLRIHRLDKTKKLLFNGYDSMILAIGRVRKKLRQNGEDER